MRSRDPRETAAAFHQSIAARDLDAVRDAVAGDVMVHSPLPGRGRELAQHAAERCFAVPATVLPQPRPCFSLLDGDVVATCYRMPQPRPDGSVAEFFWIDAARIAEGQIVEWWPSINEAAPPQLTWTERASAMARPPAKNLDPVDMKRLAVDFYRQVFDSEDASAVVRFVTEDYKQHAGHLMPGREGLEELARSLFPDGPRPRPEPMTLPPVVLVAEGDVVVHGVQLFQRPAGAGAGVVYPYIVFDAYRVSGGRLAEHWSGVNPVAPPLHADPGADYAS